MSERPASALFDAVAVVGIGLIGGSIAAALKARQLAGSVIGVGRNLPRLEAAKEAGIIDRAATDWSHVDAADLVVVCTPVDRIAADVHQAAASGAARLITDAGSVKACIGDPLRGTLPAGVHFVGSHPLAGSEKTGWEHASSDLFVDRVCVVTPDDASPAAAVERVESFWQAIGMRTQRMTAAEHDRAVAATSHVPHLAAAAVVSLVSDGDAALTSTGFRDVTRIAAGDPDLWVAILLGNQTAVLNELDRLIDQLMQYRHSLATADAAALKQILTDAKSRRDALDEESR